MTPRKRIDPPDENENDGPCSSRGFYRKPDGSNHRSPGGQKQREIATRNTSLNEPGAESIVRAVSPLEGFLNAQRALKSRFGKPFHQLREIEARNKMNLSKELDKQDENTQERKYSSNGRHPSLKRPSRNGTEKRKHFQEVFTELKTKMRNNRETGIDDDRPSNSTDISLAEVSGLNAVTKPSSDRPLCETTQTASQHITGSKGSWRPRPGKLHKLTTESSTALNKWSPFRFSSSNRGSDGFHCSSGAQFSSIVQSSEDSIQQPRSLDAKMSSWGRTKPKRQPRRKVVQLRRTKSSNSLRTQQGSGSYQIKLDVIEELCETSVLLSQIQELRNTLAKSEKVLDAFIVESKKNRTEIQDEVDHLANLYSSLIQSQDIRYRSLLDVFHENYKLLGYVESNFDYVLSVVARGRKSYFQTRFFDLLRFVADRSMAPILSIVRTGLRLYLRFFPRKQRPD